MEARELSVDVGKPCPFLIAEGVADSTDDTIEVDQ